MYGSELLCMLGRTAIPCSGQYSGQIVTDAGAHLFVQIVQHRPHHGLLFSSAAIGAKGMGVQTRLAVLQSVTPDEFDLAPGSVNYLDLLELPQRMRPWQASAVLSKWLPQVVHSSIAVVDPLTNEVLLHQVQALDI